MPVTSITPNCIFACACATSYGINPVTGLYVPVEPFSATVNFTDGPTVISSTDSDRINACLVGQNANGIIVAFRGTIPPGDPDSIPDWLEDFFDIPTTCGALPGQVHSGFCHDIHTLIEPVIAAVQSFNPAPGKPVYVTGHSKGGALASLGAYLMTVAGIPVKQVVTFASPRTGDAAFKAGYQKLIPNQIRYENYGDIVPLLPTSQAFIPALAAILAKIPNIGTELATIVAEAEGWDYEPVGAEYFIESAADGYKINTGESELDQVGDFFWNLAGHNFDIVAAVGDAHSISCRFGYMSGTCPSSLCPPSK
jgi:Lipase (class 3)